MRDPNEEHDALVRASERRLIQSLEAWAQEEIDRLAPGRIFESREAGFSVGDRRIEHVKHSLAGFTSAEDAARGCVDEMLSAWWLLAGGEHDVVVWSVPPELSRSDGLRVHWKFYVRYSFVRLQPGESLKVGGDLLRQPEGAV